LKRARPLALQHGAPADVIAHTLSGRDTGPLAAALALVAVTEPANRKEI